MADHDDRPSDDWGDVTAKWTTLATVALAVLYVAAVLFYVL
jgi:hypothetical protein